MQRKYFGAMEHLMVFIFVVLGQVRTLTYQNWLVSDIVINYKIYIRFFIKKVTLVKEEVSILSSKLLF